MLYRLLRPAPFVRRHSARRQRPGQRAVPPTPPPPPAAVSDAEKERDERIRAALVLAQEGRIQKLDEALRQLGCTHRLAPTILAYATEYHALCAAESAALRVSARGSACALDSALSPRFLARMQAVLGPDARFWRETGYLTADVGYFSYVHPLAAASGHAVPAACVARSSIDQLIRRVLELALPHFPALRQARYAEWWAHNRPHARGHQLHFDSDNEGDDGVRNPIASTVLFLSAAGGPTLVTAQTLRSRGLAPHGWLAFPRENRLVAFDGALLHSVVPGRAAFETDRRRITVMVAFWADVKTRDPPAGGRGTAQLGPARSFPDPRAPDAPGWSADFAPFEDDDDDDVDNDGGGTSGHAADGVRERPREAPIVPVKPVWMHVSTQPDKPARAVVAQGGMLPAYDAMFQGL